MSTSNQASKLTKSAGAGVLAAIVASLCCITPVFALISGVSGIAATFSWMEPARPFLIVLTIGVLGFAWYQKLKPQTKDEIDCACEDDTPSFWQSKRFLGLVTAFAAVMLAFPTYAHVFYPKSNDQSTLLIQQDTTLTHKVVLDVKGMTCAGCESHIVHEVGKLPGIKTVNASFKDATASVEYFIAKVDEDDIVEAINKTGYTVIEDQNKSPQSIEMNDNITFYKVPLVCNAAPTIGCGSRSKPVLKDLEQSEIVNEAWLNRAGTVIAIVWQESSDFGKRRSLINKVFGKHQINASELLMNDYATNLESFNNKEGWLKGAEVDQLSKEEAGIFANKLIKTIKNKTSLTSSEESKIKEKITNTFYDFFLNYKSLNELGDPDAYQKMLKEIIAFGESVKGKGSMPSMDAMWKSCSGASKSCSHKDCSSSCKISSKS